MSRTLRRHHASPRPNWSSPLSRSSSRRASTNQTAVQGSSYGLLKRCGVVESKWTSVEGGTILVMAGGEAAAVERARGALVSFAQHIILLGPLGAGATMKLAVNAMVFGLNQTLAEALVLAEKAGVARELAYEVIANSAVAAPFVGYKRTAYEHPESAPVAFALDLVAKDLDLAATLAGRVGAPVPQLETNRRVVAEAIAAGLGGADLSAIALHLRAEAGSRS